LSITVSRTRVAGVAAIALAIAGFACATVPRRTSPPPVRGSYPPRDLKELRPQTRPERTGFLETSTHADVMAFIDSLRAISPTLYVTRLGTSSKGKEIPMLVLSRPAVRTPAEAKAMHRPIVYVQGNIHGGEVEGKEALLSLLRDLSTDRSPNVLDSLVIIAVPLYNADGNDSLGPQERNRGAQNGPALIGLRPNGQGYDLNRDYIKAEAPETRAALAMFRAWDPDVFVDLHTTNGSYHGYALTWAPPLNPAAIFTGPFTRDTVLPTLREVLKARQRVETFTYGNFISQDSVERGWFTYDHRPRFGTNYYGLRGRVGILSEAYSHDPFRTRVASTYAFTSALLSLVAQNPLEFLDLGRDADRQTTAFTSTTNNSPRIPIRSRLARQGYVSDLLVEVLERTGDTARAEPGLRPGIRRTGRVRVAKVPIVDRFEPVIEQTLPFAWIIPAEQEALLAPLRANGIFIERASQPMPLRVERFMIDSVLRAPQTFQGHQEVRLTGRWSADTMTVAAGTYLVRASQPLGILSLYLLEPQSDDGFVTWNVMDAWLQAGAAYPLPRVVERISAPLTPAR
jgi:hypothetical protein